MCSNKNCFVPSLEAFKFGLQFPTLHWVFYDFFLRTVPGDEKWKKKVRESQVGNSFISTKTEAFALVLFENNYRVWLEKEKLKRNDLVTEYDIAHGNNSVKPDIKHVIDVLLPNVIIDVNIGEKDKSYIIIPSDANFTYAKQGVDIMKQKCIDAAKKNENFKDKSRDIEEMMVKLGSNRKFWTGLRVYTNGRNEENGVVTKYKGWSNTAAKVMKSYDEDIQTQEENRLKFHMSYCALFMKQESEKKKTEKPVVLLEDLWDSDGE